MTNSSRIEIIKKKNIPKYVYLIYRLGFSQLSDFLSLSQTGLILPDP